MIYQCTRPETIRCFWKTKEKKGEKREPEEYRPAQPSRPILNPWKVRKEIQIRLVPKKPFSCPAWKDCRRPVF